MQRINDSLKINRISRKENLKFKNKETNYTQLHEDNKGIYYYPLKRNFASIEEEKNYKHYYGEDCIERVELLNESKYAFFQDDVITNYIFVYLINNFKNDSDLLKALKSTFKLKNLSAKDVIKRSKLIYDRYHGIIKETVCNFWYMSCKQNEKKNILTLFQNNKQLFCNIDCIYDCNFHTGLDSNFENPSIYNQIEYLKCYKKLLETAFICLENNDDITDVKTEIVNNEIIYHLEDSKKLNNNSKKYFEKLSKNNNNTIDNNNHLDYKKYYKELIIEFNQLLKNNKCPENIVSPINLNLINKDENENKKQPCCSLCYKNLLSSKDDKLINKAFNDTLNRDFPFVYELLLLKFMQIIKFDPCHIYKLIKQFIDPNSKINIDCFELFFHLIKPKNSIQKIIDKNFFQQNLKEIEILKNPKNLQNQIKNRPTDGKYLPYSPCSHFGNQTCTENCICAKRGYCERFCKCNINLCKYAFHGCHCTKGDCNSSHCSCFLNSRECDPVLCKNCFKNKCKNKQLLLNMQSKIIVGESKIAGWGLFANEDIKKDALIGEYKGELINADITNKRDKYKNYENSTYMFTLDDEFTVDSRRMGNLLRYANHSRINANSYPRVVLSGGHHRIGLFAKRHIYKGEEIRFDYDGQGILSEQFSWINDEVQGENEKVKVNKNKRNKKKVLKSVKKEEISEKENVEKKIDKKVSDESVLSVIEDKKENDVDIIDVENDVNDDGIIVEKKDGVDESRISQRIIRIPNDDISDNNSFSDSKEEKNLKESKNDIKKEIENKMIEESDIENKKEEKIIEKIDGKIVENKIENDDINRIKILNILENKVENNDVSKIENNVVNKEEKKIEKHVENKIESNKINKNDQKNMKIIENNVEFRIKQLLNSLNNSNSNKKVKSNTIDQNTNIINKNNNTKNIENNEEKNENKITPNYNLNENNTSNNINNKNSQPINSIISENVFEFPPNKSVILNNSISPINSNLNKKEFSTNMLEMTKTLLNKKRKISKNSLDDELLNEFNNTNITYNIKNNMNNSFNKKSINSNHINNSLIQNKNRSISNYNTHNNHNSYNYNIEINNFNNTHNYNQNNYINNNNTDNNINNSLNNNIKNIYNNNNLNRSSSNSNSHINNISTSNIKNNDIIHKKNLSYSYKSINDSFENSTISNNEKIFENQKSELYNKFQNNDNASNSQENILEQVRNYMTNNQKIYKLGLVKLTLDFKNPFLADFTFYSPIQNDIFQKHQTLKLTTQDILEEINIDFNKDIFGYLGNDNCIKGYSIFLSYLKFFKNRVYYCCIEDKGLNVYLFIKGDVREMILKRCGLDPENNKQCLVFLVKKKGK